MGKIQFDGWDVLVIFLLGLCIGGWGAGGVVVFIVFGIIFLVAREAYRDWLDHDDLDY